MGEVVFAQLGYFHSSGILQDGRKQQGWTCEDLRSESLPFGQQPLLTEDVTLPLFRIP